MENINYFELEFKRENFKIVLKGSYKSNIDNEEIIELAYKLAAQYNIPFYLHEELQRFLKYFIKKDIESKYDAKDDMCINSLKCNNLIEVCTNAFAQNVKGFSKIPIKDERELFLEVYQGLIHSSALENIIHLEMELIETFEKELKDILQLSKDIISLEDYHLISKLSTLHQSFKNQFLNEVVKIHTQLKEGTLKQLTTVIREFGAALLVSDIQQNTESFTIHLGMQMKQTLNLRITTVDLFKFSTYHSYNERKSERLHSLFNLYENNLNGLVLLCPGGIIHSDVFEQILNIRNFVLPKVIEWRQRSQENLVTEQFQTYCLKEYFIGDVLITHHSNIPEVQVIFHLVTDGSVDLKNLNSRHPVILGLRNVLRIASLCDIKTLTIPLLLTEELTVSLCMKVAELVFKCIKGFMIEMYSWGGSQIKTLQFLLPEGISEDLFTSITSLLSGIFRVSSPNQKINPLKIMTLLFKKYQNRIYKFFSCATQKTITQHTDLIGPLDNKSNLLCIQFNKPHSNCSKLEKKYYKLRKEVYEWNHNFWKQHNEEFLQTSQDLSLFYKKNLDDKWNVHWQYNWLWYKYNIKVTLLAAVVTPHKLIMKLYYKIQPP